MSAPNCANAKMSLKHRHHTAQEHERLMDCHTSHLNANQWSIHCRFFIQCVTHATASYTKIPAVFVAAFAMKSFYLLQLFVNWTIHCIKFDLIYHRHHHHHHLCLLLTYMRGAVQYQKKVPPLAIYLFMRFDLIHFSADTITYHKVVVFVAGDKQLQTQYTLIKSNYVLKSILYLFDSILRRWRKKKFNILREQKERENKNDFTIWLW